MRVQLTKVDESLPADARIIRYADNLMALPSCTDGWRFNFRKHSKKPAYETYVLICVETPDIIEGCLIFEMKAKVEPYMAYVEVAPHNKGKGKKFDRVAGCLIAFACRLSFIHGENDFRGWLAFDVLEEDRHNEIKLMALYLSLIHI